MGGNVVVVHKDRGTLRKQHVEALCRFFLDVLRPLFDQSGAGKMPKQWVMDELTQSAFVRFRRDYSWQKRGSVLGWENRESPV